MDEQRSTTHLAGWIRPGSPYLCGDDLYLRSTAALPARRQRSPSSWPTLRHGFPASPGGGTPGLPGNWLELCGSVEPSRIGDETHNPEHVGELTVGKQRPNGAPRPRRPPRRDSTAVVFEVTDKRTGAATTIDLDPDDDC